MPSKLGHEQRQRLDQVRRQLDQQRALEQRLAHQAEVEVLEVAQAAVDQLRRAAGGARPRSRRARPAPRCSRARRRRAPRPAPVMPPPTTTRSNESRSSEASASARGITAGTLRSRRAGGARAAPCPGAAGPGGSGRARARRAGTPTAARALGRAQHAGRAPVAGQPARVRGEQHVGDRRRPPRTGPPRPGRRRRSAPGSPPPASARGRAWRRPPARRPASARASDSGPSTRKRHGLVRLWLGAQRASSNSSSSSLARHRLGPVGLVRAPRADGVFELHRGRR